MANSQFLFKTKLIHSIIILVFMYTLSTYSQSIIKTLPGFNGDLPFKLETGYIGVGENEEMQLFYYFIESETDPKTDPLVLSLIGGPGCSGLSTLAFEFGPILFDISKYDTSRLPSFVLNPYSWTKMANIIFLDWPSYSGFSYATNPNAYYTSDSSSPKEIYAFLRKWLLSHPTFLKNPLYIEGESYAGKIVPMVAWEIARANEAGSIPQMSLQGYFVGNPLTNSSLEVNERVQYAYNMALITDYNLKLAESSCGGEYFNIDATNFQCQYALQLIDKVIETVDHFFVLWSACPKNGTIFLPSAKTKVLCQAQTLTLSEIWANNPIVRNALGVREGTIGKWMRCNTDNSYYDKDIASSAKYHQFVIEKGYRGLVYSGDHDMIVPYTSTLKWTRSLNLTLDEPWRPWKLDYYAAGFTERYGKDGSYLTFATVRASGHTIATYTPEAAFVLISRWLLDKQL